MRDTYTIAFRNSDEFGAVAGSGWVILCNGKRLDWPMLATREEAEAERLDFIKEVRAMRAEQASERRFMIR
jgi:hypothetical protein